MSTGRKTALTHELQEEIFKLARVGAPKRVIAEAVGIAPATMFKWLKFGDDDWVPKEGQECPKDREPYRDFRDGFVRARTRPILICEATWMQAVQGVPAVPEDKERGIPGRAAIPGDARAAASWLKTHEPDLYVEKVTLDLQADSIVDALKAYENVIGRLASELRDD